MVVARTRTRISRAPSFGSGTRSSVAPGAAFDLTTASIVSLTKRTSSAKSPLPPNVSYQAAERATASVGHSIAPARRRCKPVGFGVQIHLDDGAWTCYTPQCHMIARAGHLLPQARRAPLPQRLLCLDENQHSGLRVQVLC